MSSLMVPTGRMTAGGGAWSTDPVTSKTGSIRMPV
jgi:hypothetical protein